MAKHLTLLVIIWIGLIIPQQFVNCNEAFDVFGKVLMQRIMRNDEIEFALEMVKIKIDGFLSKANLTAPCSQFRRLLTNELEKGSFWTFQCEYYQTIQLES